MSQTRFVNIGHVSFGTCKNGNYLVSPFLMFKHVLYERKRGCVCYQDHIQVVESFRSVLLEYLVFHNTKGKKEKEAEKSFFLMIESTRATIYFYIALFINNNLNQFV